MAKFDLETTPLGTVLDDPQAAAVFEEFVPGFADHPMLSMAKGMPIGTVLNMAGGQLGADNVVKLKEELAKL